MKPAVSLSLLSTLMESFVGFKSEYHCARVEILNQND
ncbi:MAG: hypothetical protein ACJAXK_001940 [Yoonia sp.]|jgi:hypothetical protein